MVAWRSEDVLGAGLLGPEPFAAPTIDRVGDVVAVLRKGYSALGSRAADAERAMAWNGRHGGLTADEMEVPWLAFRLDAA